MTQHQDPSNVDPGETPHSDQDEAAELTPEPDVPGESATDEVTTPGDADASDNPQAELEQVRAEAHEAKEQLARLKADTENIRKRSQREVESARKFGLEKFAGDLLEVRDSLEMGLEAANEPDADFKQFYEGMELTRRNLAGSMEKAGIEVVNPEGEAFNPEQHEAVTMQPTEEYAPNTVVSVMKKGYLLNDRVLRAAMVAVAKAPDDAQ